MLIVAVIWTHCYTETVAYNLLSILLICAAAHTSTEACLNTVCLPSVWWFLPASVLAKFSLTFHLCINERGLSRIIGDVLLMHTADIHTAAAKATTCIFVAVARSKCWQA